MAKRKFWQFYNLKALNKCLHKCIFTCFYISSQNQISVLQMTQSPAHGAGTLTGLTKTAFFVI